MDGYVIGETPLHKHLRLTFSKTCSWDEHIVNISEKAWTRVNLLKALKFRVEYVRFGKPMTSNLQAGVHFRDALEHLHLIDMHFVLHRQLMAACTRL